MSQTIPESAAVESQGGYYPISITYNSQRMNKAELMAYLYEITRYKKQFQEHEQRKAARSQKIQTLEQEIKCRRTFPEPYMAPPSGFARLSRRRMRVYQQWLNDAPKREAERKEKEKEESDRIGALNKQYNELQDEAFTDIVKMNTVALEYKKLMDRAVLAPDYRDGDIPHILLMYLFNGRANTLTEAVNLYHEEQHRMELLAIAQQQRREAYIAKQRELDLIWKQMELQREQTEHLAEIAQTSKETRDVAKRTELLAWMDYLTK